LLHGPHSKTDARLIETTVVNRRKALFLLTDGQPNVLPPRGHIAELHDYKDKYPDFSFQVNTFGFGYNLDSELLLDLAVEGAGTYAFIPDAVIVGTTFVNAVANVLSSFSQSATLSLCPKNGAKFAGPVLGFRDFSSSSGSSAARLVSEESWGRWIMLCSVISPGYYS